jgi:hypothetical protein
MTPQSVGLLWTRDRSVVETSTQQHTTLTRVRRLCSQRDSNSQFPKANDRKPSPWTSRLSLHNTSVKYTDECCCLSYFVCEIHESVLLSNHITFVKCTNVCCFLIILFCEIHECVLLPQDLPFYSTKAPIYRVTCVYSTSDQSYEFEKCNAVRKWEKLVDR